MRSRVGRRNRLGSSPRTCTSPPDGSSAPVIMRIVVVLPAPDGPTIPRIVPAGTVRSTSNTPTPSPKSRVAPRSTTSPSLLGETDVDTTPAVGSAVVIAGSGVGSDAAAGEPGVPDASPGGGGGV